MPQKVLLQNEQTLRNYESQILGMMIVNDHVFDNLKKLLKQYKKQVVIFGSSIIALSMAKKLSETCKVKYILNLQSNGIWNGIQAVKIDEQPLPPPVKNLPVIFADLQMPPGVPEFLRKNGCGGQFIGLNEIFGLQ